MLVNINFNNNFVDEYKKLRDERMQELYYLGVLLVKSFNCSVNNTMLIMVLLILWLWLHQKHFQPGFEDILPESMYIIFLSTSNFINNIDIGFSKKLINLHYVTCTM